MTIKVQQYFDLLKVIEENLFSYIEENNQDNSFFKYLGEQKININKQIIFIFISTYMEQLSSY